MSIRTTDESVVIEITDDGRGLPARPVASGLGLLGMRERVRAIGGIFEIGNRPNGSGVAVRATFAEQATMAAAE